MPSGETYMIVETVNVKLADNEDPNDLQVGQVINAFCDNMECEIPVIVTKIHKDGNFDGKVIWEEA